VARLLVERGARHLVLLGRHTGGVEALEAMGARVVSARVDVADEQALARLMDEVSRTLPPLRGVIHSAGVLEDGVLLQQDEERLARALAPKVRGALHLHQLTRGLELDFFVLFSSSAALLGPTGQGPHAAANAFLGALAHTRRAAGLPATTIDWSAWSEVGQAAAYAELARSAGITPLSPAQGLRALEAALALGQPQVGVLPVQWARYALSRGRPLPLLAELVPVTAAPSPTTPELVRRLRALPASSRRAHLVAHLQALVSSLLGLEPSKPPEPEAGFFSLGMDSLRVITLKNRLQEELGHPLASSLVFNHPSAAALGEYLEQELFGSSPPPPAPSAPAAPAAPQGLETELEAHIDELSEAEAEALLMGRLASLEDSQS
jgi:acyl carrier protein